MRRSLWKSRPWWPAVNSGEQVAIVRRPRTRTRRPRVGRARRRRGAHASLVYKRNCRGAVRRARKLVPRLGGWGRSVSPGMWSGAVGCRPRLGGGGGGGDSSSPGPPVCYSLVLIRQWLDGFTRLQLNFPRNAFCRGVLTFPVYSPDFNIINRNGLLPVRFIAVLLGELLESI